jgi:hypothetical protein
MGGCLINLAAQDKVTSAFFGGVRLSKAWPLNKNANS